VEADQDLPDTAADPVEEHGVQLQPEEVPEPRRTGNRLRAADQHRPELSERRAATCQQILQQQPYAYADHELTVVAVQQIEHAACPAGSPTGSVLVEDRPEGRGEPTART